MTIEEIIQTGSEALIQKAISVAPWIEVEAVKSGYLGMTYGKYGIPYSWMNFGGVKYYFLLQNGSIYKIITGLSSSTPLTESNCIYGEVPTAFTFISGNDIAYGLGYIYYPTSGTYCPNIHYIQDIDIDVSDNSGYLQISGTDVSKYIQSLSIEHEPVWSTNAGRTLDGTFQGDIICWKWKLQITTRPLTQEESSIVTSLIKKGAFFDVKFIPPDSQDDTLHTARVYTNAPASVVYSYHENLIRYQSLAFNLIEQ